MAEPNDPNAPATDTNLDKTGELANKAAQAFGVLHDAADGVKSVLERFNAQAERLGVSLKTNQALTQDQAAAFGILSSSIIGTRDAFENLGGVSIDTTGLDTFKKQWLDLEGLMKGGGGGQALMALKNKAMEMLQAQGASKSKIAEIANMGAEAFTGFARNFFASADNGMKLQNVMVQLAAKTGTLNQVTTAAGPGLEKINLLLAQQQDVITKAAGATKLGADVVEQYYAQLGTVPRALESTVKGANTAGQAVSMLTATIQFAKGSGRGYADVVNDLKFAYKELGIQGEPALKFTARMSELSNKFGIELEEVQSALKGTADTFKLFGNNAEGAAKMYNQYLGQLQATGVSGKTALDMMSQLTAGIKGMGIAQKAFLSAQTGGAGGLQGAFQIEKMLREGKMDQVFDKVRQTMNKTMGPAVTLDEAASSPQAAAQLTKQIAMLRQGPLGQFAKDDQSAMRILEAFRAKDQGKVVDLKETVLQDTMKTGVDLQEKSVTELSRIRELLQANQGFANIANYTTAQQGLTAGIGAPMQGADYNAQFRDNLKQSSINSAIGSGTNTAAYAKEVKSKIITDRSGEMAADVIGNYKTFFNELGPALKAPIAKIRELFKSGKDTDAKEEYKQFMANIQQKRKDLANAPAMLRASGMQELDQQEQVMKTAYGALASSNGAAGENQLAPKFNPNIDPSELGLAGDNVRQAAGRAAQSRNVGTAPATAAAGGTTPGAAPQQGGHLGDLTVHVEGYCIECGEKMKGSRKSESINVGPNVRK